MLRVYLNGNLVTEIPLPAGEDFNDHERLVVVPVEYMRPSSNTLMFSYDFVLKNPGAEAAVPAFGSILEGTALDVTGLAHWTRMPNLELFANAGYPFTRRADLAETTVVLPTVPSAEEIELYLLLMSHMGTQTGAPALRVNVTGPDVTIVPDRDYLVLGTIVDQPAFAALDASLPVSYDSNGIHVKQAESVLTPLQRRWAQLLGNFGITNAGPATPPSNDGGPPDAMVEELESPSAPGRTIVMIVLKENGSVEKFADAFLPRSQSSDLNGSVSLLRGNLFTSYSVESKVYFIGNITWYAAMRIWMTQYYLALLLIVIVLSLILAGWTRQMLDRKAAIRLKLAHVKSSVED
jgi:cellulose synthase (UDP-forming)